MSIPTEETTNKDTTPVQPTEGASESPTSQPYQQNTAPSRSNKPIIILLVVVFGILPILVLAAAGGIYAMRHSIPNSNPALTSTADGNKTVTQVESTISTAAEKIAPSVVSIVAQTGSDLVYDASGAAGTGIIVSKDGYIMTNNHVIESARSVTVVDSNGDLYQDVAIIGRDPLNDVAFLKIRSDKTFTPAELGNSSTIRIGQQVVAVGNALGQYNNTVTSGIISGTGRPVTASSGEGNTESLTDLLQTDASINPGNSGGPLVNVAGQVIGINTAIIEDANGIGFAIPINATKGVLAGVLENGKVSRSFLGVNYLTVTPDIAREYNLPTKSGAYIYAKGTANPVAANSPAAKAGLKSGDIITKINSETVGAQGNLSSILGEYRPGDKLTITYLRNGKEDTTSLVLSTYQAS